MRIAWSKNYEDIDIRLVGKGLKAHTAIIAQSGSGKSYTLGRILEEVCLKTKAKICVLDSNADFIHFHRINEDIWKNDDFKKKYLHDELITHFRNNWNNVKLRILSQRSRKHLKKTKHLSISRVYIKWNELSYLDQMLALEMDIEQDPSYLLLCRYLRSESIKISYLEGISGLKAYLNILSTILGEFHLAGIENRDPDLPAILPNVISMSTVLDVYNHFVMNIFPKPYYKMHREIPLPKLIRDFYESDESILTLDLPSIKDENDQSTICIFVLDAIWEQAIKLWDMAINNDDIRKKRFPLFIVVDEAHNLIPEKTDNKIRLELLQKFKRIATEGRKYGLFLIVATQRPTRVNKTVISQCDNLILQRMTNRVDIDLVEENFSFIPEGWCKESMNFDVGEAALCGRFVNIPEIVKIAPRRTVEGGANIDDTFWLKK